MVGGAGGASTSKIPVPPLNPKPSNSPEVIIKQLEAKVNSILEESAEAATRGDDQMVRGVACGGVIIANENL